MSVSFVAHLYVIRFYFHIFMYACGIFCWFCNSRIFIVLVKREKRINKLTRCEKRGNKEYERMQSSPDFHLYKGLTDRYQSEISVI